MVRRSAEELSEPVTEWRRDASPLRDDAGHERSRRHVECRIANLHSVRRDALAGNATPPGAGPFAALTLAAARAASAPSAAVALAALAARGLLAPSTDPAT